MKTKEERQQRRQERRGEEARKKKNKNATSEEEPSSTKVGDVEKSYEVSKNDKQTGKGKSDNSKKTYGAIYFIVTLWLTLMLQLSSMCMQASYLISHQVM